MIRILCCWELGGGLGHLFRLLPLGREFADRGCDVIYALPHTTGAEMLRGDHRCRVVQSPVWQPPPRSHPLSQTYAQNLLRNGYWHRESLQDQLKGWLGVFEACQPDLVVAEHAPSALLAVRKAGLPRAAIGTGFSLPSLMTPMAGLQPWFTLPEHHLLKIEREFLDCVNPALADVGAAPLAAVSEIFEGAERFLCTLPELDHYGARPDERYYGPVLYTSESFEADWPSDNRDNILVYLRPESRFFHPIIELLKEMRLPAVAFAPGVSEAERRRLGGETLSISPHPVNLKTAAVHCRLMIGHGGHNTGALMLLAGVPLFICPMQLEQAVWAYRICAQGLGAMVNFLDPEPDFKGKTESLLCARTVANHVRSFAGKWASFDPAKQVEETVEQCLAGM